MNKDIKKRSWKMDIIKIENWLNQMHSKGYALKNANLKKGKFSFEISRPENACYRIGYEKDCIKVPEQYLSDDGFEEVCLSGDYYIIKTKNANPPFSPSYREFWESNLKKKTSFGAALLVYGLTFGIILVSLFI